MSRTTTARRFSLLASTSFVAANMIAGAGALMATAFMPSVALAGCNPDATGTVNPASLTETCAGSDADITYTGLNHKFDVILDGENVTTSGITITSGASADLGLTNVLNASTVKGGINVFSQGNTTIDFSDAAAPVTVNLAAGQSVWADTRFPGPSGSDATVLIGKGTVINSPGSGKGFGAVAVGTSNGDTKLVNDGAINGGAHLISQTGSVNYSGKGTIANLNGDGLELDSSTGSGSASVVALIDGTVSGSLSGVAVGDGGVFMPGDLVVITNNATVTGGVDGMNIFNTNGETLTVNAAVVGKTGAGIVVNDASKSGFGIFAPINADVTGATDGVNFKETGAISFINLVTKTGTTIKGGANGAVLDAIVVFGTLDGNITGGTGDGLKVTAGTGGANITASGVIKTTGGDGIDITSKGGIKLLTTGKVSGDPAVLLNDASAIGITYDVAGGADGLLDGVKATETGTGAIDIAVKSLVQGDSDNNGSGNGVKTSATTGTTTVTLTAAGVIDGTSQTGISATQTGASGAGNKIIIVNDGKIGSTGNPVDTVGITATIANPGAAGSISITGNGTIDSTAGGITANNVGKGDVTIAHTGAITTGNGAFAIQALTALGGSVDITTGPGAVKGGGGINATNLSGKGTIDVTIGGDILATNVNGQGILAQSLATGLIKIDAKAGTTAQVTGGTSTVGILAQNLSATGAVTIDLSGATIGVQGGSTGILAQTVGKGDVNIITSGLVKSGTGAGVVGISVDGNIFVNGAGPITVTGNSDGIVVASNTGNLTVGNTGGGYAGAIDPQGGGNGIDATITNTASTGDIKVTTATGGTISGTANNGIFTSTKGLGSITVDQGGAIGSAGNGVTSNGVGAQIQNAANTKDVSVKAKASIEADLNGVLATTTGLGAVTVDQTAGTITAGFHGVLAQINNATNTKDVNVSLAGNIVAKVDGAHVTTNGLGSIVVNQTAGDITGDHYGIDAFISNPLNVGGSVKVTTSAGAKVTGGEYGIIAQTFGEGDVFLTNGAAVKSTIADALYAAVDGPGAVSSDGSVSLINTGSATSANGSGAEAHTNSNDDVTVTNSGDLTGALFGIHAVNLGVGGAVTVTQTAGSSTQTGLATDAGISATITNVGNSDLVFVDVQGGKVDAQGNGVFAQTKGTGNVKVDNAGTIDGGLSGTAGDGIQANALGGGNVLVNNTGTVTGDPGIKASAIGFGTVTVVTSGVVSAVKDGIQTTTVDGTNTVTVSGAGTVTSTTEDGIDATTSGIGLIDINTAAGTTITTTGGANGILANQTGTGDIDIDAFGAITAGTGGISATTANGTIDILTGSGKIQAGGGGTGIFATSVADKNVTVTTGTGDVAGSVPGFGIAAASAGGNVQINVGSGGSSEGGVVGQTTKTGTVIVNVGGDVNDSAFEGVRATSEAGLSQVTLQAGKSIKAGSTAGVLQSTTSGPIIFTGLAGSSITSNIGDGINASSTLAGGTITITHAGSITTTGAGSDGVDAQTADATINITVDGAVTASAKGLSGIAGGANAVNITNNGAVKATGGEGLNLASAGGTVTATANGTVEGTTAGIKTRTSGAGKTNVDANNTVTATAGIGIDALTTGAGLIDIDTAAVNGTAGGIQATSAGGNITVDNAGAVNGDTDGNKAGTGIKANTSGAGIITVTLGGAVSGGVGIDIATTGTGALNVVDGGFAVTGTGGDGIKASGGTGNVNIGTGPGSRVIGPISGADDGIDAKGAGNVNVYVQGDVTGDTDGDGVGDGIHAETSGVGAFSVIVDSTGGAIKAGDDGIEALGLGAGVTVKVTNTDSVNSAGRSGIWAQTTDGAVTVDNKGAIASTAFGQTVNEGIWAESITGTVQVDNTGNIGAAGAGGGTDSDGIVAWATGVGTNTVTVKNSGDIFVDAGGYGIWAVTNGTGDVLVDNKGIIDPPATGIYGSGGGNVTISTSKNVTGTSRGIWGNDFGVAGKALTITVTGGAVITGQADDGIKMVSSVGANVTLDAKTSGLISGGTNGVFSTLTTGGNNGTTTIDTAAQVTGTTVDGIHADTVGNGAIKINAGAVTGGQDGVQAASTGGSSITVTTGGSVLAGTGSGILTSTTGTGVTNITSNALVNAVLGNGIAASTTGSGAITVTSNGSVSGGSNGITATSGGGSVITVNNNGTTTGVAGDGVIASSTGAATVTVNIGGTTTGNVNGVHATSSGAGTVNVNDAGGFAVTGKTNNGIWADSSGGDVNVGSSNANRITGVVSGADNGIVAFAGKTSTVFTGADVTGDSDNNGLGVGIWAQSTGAGGAVLINSKGGTVKSGDIGILGQAGQPGGTVTIVNDDAVQVRDGEGIYAQTSTGAISVTNSGAVGTNAFATGLNYGIIATSTTGQITIVNTGALGSYAGGGTSGLDTYGILASSNGANTAGITVTNSGVIAMDAGSAAGIAVDNTGTGTVTVNNTGAIDPALFGVNAKGGGDVTVNNAANILAGTGIHAESTSVSAGNIVSVYQRAPGTSIVGSAGNGIEASIAGPGAVRVGTPLPGDRIQGNVTGTGAGANGIFATGKGDIIVYTGAGTITGGATGAAWGIKVQSTSVLADAVADEIVIDTQGAIVGRQGILASNTGLTLGTQGVGDSVTVNTSAASTVTGNDGDGIRASSAAGDINIGVAAAVSATGVTQSAIGIKASSSAGGNVSVFAGSGATVTSAGATGADAINASAAAAGNVIVTTTAGGNVSGATNGIRTSTTTGSTTINTLTSTNSANIKSVVGNAGDGINASSTSGAITVTSGNVTGQGAAANQSHGIIAISSAGGTVIVNTTGTVQGDLTGSAAGGGAIGLRAESFGGNGSVTVNTATTTNVAVGVVQGGNAGIVATTVGQGVTTVNVGAGVQVTGLGAGTVLFGTGPLGIQAIGGDGGAGSNNGVLVGVGANATVRADNGRAIRTISNDNTLVAIAAGALVTGIGSDAGHGVIEVNDNSVDGRATITSAGLITSTKAAPSSYGDVAIVASNAALAGVAAGGATINNTGGINGRIIASGLTGANTLVFNNAAGGVWHTTGASTFGPGADTITNAGQIFTNNAGSVTSIDFGAGADTFTNTGALVAGEAQVAASASNLVLTGLETFTNNGQISFGGSVGASDNAINDKINAAGALFGGTGKLFMDADLWSISQATCAALTAADCLAVGTTTGLNSIVVNDINTHAVGAFNPNGIALVTGSTNAGANFKLDPASEWYNAAKFGGVLDKPGLFFYDLAWSAANGGTTLLIGVPDTEAFELSELGNAAQSIWYSSTGTWFDRQADLRQSLAGRSEGWAPSVWLKVVGDWTQRDNITSFSIFNKVYAFDVGYNQDTVGLIGGIDFLNVRDGDEAYVFGGQVGYMDSDVRFNSPTRSNFSGMVVGLYGTYMNGGFFLDGIANANFLDLHHYVPTLPGPPAPGSANADVTSFGGQVEAGYQMAIGATGFWEPLASLAYVHTEIDALSLGGNGSVDFPSTVSFRGSLGARVGMSGDFQYYKVRVALTGRLWDEFDGDNSIVVISPGPSNFATNDDFGGTFGEVTLGGNLFTTGGNLSAFANVGVKFRSDYQSTNVSVGFRYQW